MATIEQTELVLECLHEAYPHGFVKTLRDGNAGISAVLQLLHKASATVTAGTISEFMNVSTARVSVLLKKMEKKGIIKKEKDTHDARVTNVYLSDKGEEKVQQIQSKLYEQVGMVIDKVGMDRMVEFINISHEINKTMKSEDLEV